MCACAWIIPINLAPSYLEQDLFKHCLRIEGFFSRSASVGNCSCTELEHLWWLWIHFEKRPHVFLIERLQHVCWREREVFPRSELRTCFACFGLLSFAALLLLRAVRALAPSVCHCSRATCFLSRLVVARGGASCPARASLLRALWQ